MNIKSIQSGYLPSLDVGATYATTKWRKQQVFQRIQQKLMQHLVSELYDGGKRYDTYDSYESTIKSEWRVFTIFKKWYFTKCYKLLLQLFILCFTKEAKLKEIEQLDSQLTRLSRF